MHVYHFICLQNFLTLIYLFLRMQLQAPEVQTDAAQDEPPTKPTGATIPTHHSILVQFCTS